MPLAKKVVGEHSADQERKNRTRRSWSTIRVALFCDLVAVLLPLLFSVLALQLSPLHENAFRSTRIGDIAVTLIITAIWIGCIWATGGYNFRSRMSGAVGMGAVFKASMWTLGIVAVLSISFNLPLLQKLALPGFFALVLLLILRGFSSRRVQAIRRATGSRLLIVGTVAEINQRLGNDPQRKFPYHKVTALLVTDSENLAKLRPVEDCAVIPFESRNSISEVVSKQSCDSVWIADVYEFGHKNLRRLAWDLQRLNTRLYLDPVIDGVGGTRIKADGIGPFKVLAVEHPRFNAANGILKRLFDICFSALALTMVSPLLLATAIAIKLEDRGPVFYLSERIGRQGKPFMVWKFRSMYVDADKHVADLIKRQGGDGMLFKMKDDPRVTKTGRLIRKLSIDELPQFINSFMGSMSVVGPRPPLRREVELYDNDMRMRLEVRPGITGLWQVSGRSDLTLQQARTLDLYYVDNWSFGYDLRIIYRTLGAVLNSEGAY